MARAYSAVLGSIALIIVILRGLLASVWPDEILSGALAAFAAFAVVGYCIGYFAERTVCDSVEFRFRKEMARLQSTVNSKTPDGVNRAE